MIIYGSKSKELAKEHITDKCPNCSTPNSITIYVFQKYAHVFWIPFFPMNKIGASQCDHCKQVLKQKEMPAALKSDYERLAKQAKTPVWMFAGLALVALLIITGIISDKNKDAKNARLILTPQAGDIFKIKAGDNQYTLYKVEEVAGDSVILHQSNYQVNKETGLDELKNKAYSNDLYSFSKKEIKAMLDKGEIIDIDR